MSLDYTLFIQLGIFLYVLFVLRALFFKPILKILNRREQLTSGRIGEAADMKKEMEQIKEHFDSEIATLRNSLEEQRHEALRRTKEIAEKKLTEAKARIERQGLEKRGLLEQDHKKLKARIPELRDSIAQEIVSAMTHSRVVRS